MEFLCKKKVERNNSISNDRRIPNCNVIIDFSQRALEAEKVSKTKIKEEEVRMKECIDRCNYIYIYQRQI